MIRLNLVIQLILKHTLRWNIVNPTAQKDILITTEYIVCAPVLLFHMSY